MTYEDDLQHNEIDTEHYLNWLNSGEYIDEIITLEDWKCMNALIKGDKN